MEKQFRFTVLMVLSLAAGLTAVLPGTAQSEVITFSDLAAAGQPAVPADYQPPELEETGITTTWTGWYSFNDDEEGEGLRDHTETWDPGTSVYIYAYDAGGSIGFSPAVEVSSIWIYRDSWSEGGVIVGNSGGQEVWSEDVSGYSADWVEITAGAGETVDEIVVPVAWARFDDITVVVEVPCNTSANPVPSIGAPNVDPAITKLGWDQPTCADVGYSLEVYFGTDPCIPGNSMNVTAANDINISLFTSLPLSVDTPYYWRVDVNDPNGNVPPGGVLREGKDWSFTTWPATPLILTQPEVAVTVPAGDPASFTVESGGNLAGSHTYQWYYYANPGDANTLLVDANSSTYTDNDVQLGDEGYYLCVVTGAGSTTSDAGRLLTRRLMAHWKLDGNANCTSCPYNGTEVGDPNYVTGINGSAVQIQANHFVMVNDAIGLLNDITVSMWVKPDSLADALFFVPQAGEDEGYGGNNAVHFFETPAGTLMGEVTGGLYLGVPDALTASEWNHIVFVYDTTNEVAHYHVNGSLMGVDGVYEQEINADILPNLLPLSMGRRNLEDDWGIFELGLIDDVQVYNYPLSPMEVAEMYLAFEPAKTACIGPVEFDFNGDCELNSKDAAIFFDMWLTEDPAYCNIVPDCIPPVLPE